MSGQGTSRWPIGLGMAAAVSLHVLAAVLTLNWSPETQQAEAGAGVKVILGGASAPATGAAAPEAEMAAEPLQQAEATPLEPQETPPEALEPEPLPEVAEAVEPPPEPLPEPEVPKLADDSPLPAVLADIVEAAKEPPPEPALVVPPKPKVKPIQEAQKAKPLEPKPLKKLAPPPAPAPAPAQQLSLAAAPALARKGSGGPEESTLQSRGQQSGQVGLAGDREPEIPPAYLMRLVAWLEKHKSYPRAARRGGKEGIVTLRFVLARDGKVMAVEALKSSGHAALDSAAERLPWEAEPFPAFPNDMDRSKLTIIVPLAYHLR